MATKAASSKREAREFIQGQSISINGETVQSLTMTLNQPTALFGKYLVMRRGKKHYSLIELV
jgi:tyrosyl-tRNA synthetase